MKSTMPKSHRLRFLLVLILGISLIPGSTQQSMRGNRDGRNKKRRPSAKEEKDRNVRSLTINYPLNIFETGRTKDWRAPAKFSTELELASKTDAWKEFSHAQDQEDIWLYENWFYGMEGGVIMESGALDGLLFSNSFLFEQFANWTAIHVGKSVQMIVIYCSRVPSINC
jgi:hypothetical protein